MSIHVIAAALTACCLIASPALSQSSEEIVAEVEEQQITVEELSKYVESRAYLYRYPDPSEAYRFGLDALITDELKRIDFFRSGLAQTDSVVRDLQRIVTEEIGLAYVKARYEDRYLNEDAIRAEHEDMGRVVFYRQIVLKKPMEASEAELDSLRAAVHRIREKLEGGVAFDSLATRYSDNPDAAAERLTWGQTVRSPRNFILFHLSPGDIRSFEGPHSFTIARIERVEPVLAPPLEHVRDRIVHTLQVRHAAQATRAYRDEWNALVDTLSLSWNSAALEQMVDWANTAGFFEGEYQAVVGRHLRRHGDAVVLRDDYGTVRLSDLPVLISEVLTLEEASDHKADYIKEYLLEAVRTQRLADRGRALGLENEVWRPDTPSPGLAQAFVRIYNATHIDDRMPQPTEAALRAFYEAHDDSLFYQLARVNTEIIIRKEKDQITAVLDVVKAGVPFEEASHRRLLRSFQRTREGEIEALYTREPPYLGDVAFDLQVGEIAGPVAYDDAEDGRVYAIVRATKRVAERQLTFEEVRERVEEAFLEHHEARLAERLASDLRNRYEVVVHHDVLAQLSGESL